VKRQLQKAKSLRICNLETIAPFAVRMGAEKARKQRLTVPRVPTHAGSCGMR